MMIPLDPEFEAWLKTRPPNVEALGRRFPPGTKVLVEGVPHHVIGYTEDDELIVSQIDPTVNYELALSMKQLICASCVKELE